MYENQRDAVLATCGDKWHWSSSEVSYYYVWMENFGDGDWNGYFKVNYSNSVRAVRAF